LGQLGSRGMIDAQQLIELGVQSKPVGWHAE
jgi:hypothetical protein